MKTRAKGYRNVRVLREEDKEKGEAQKERERKRERERERERETVGDEEGRGDFECVRGNSFHLFFLLQIQFWLSILPPALNLPFERKLQLQLLKANINFFLGV